MDSKNKAEKQQKAATEDIKSLKPADADRNTIKKIVKAPAEKPDRAKVEGNITIGGSSQTSSGDPEEPVAKPAAKLTTVDAHRSASPSVPAMAAPEPTTVPTTTAVIEATPALYASTTLQTYETTNDDVYRPEEIIINDVSHRRVDAAYFAYLRENLEQATKAYQDGRIEGKDLAIALAKFVKIERWVLEHVGGRAVAAAIEERKNGGGYWPERVKLLSVIGDSSDPDEPRHLFPSDGPWRFTHPVDQASIDKVDQIRYLAMALGWSEAELYQNRGMFKFPQGPGWGLVCFIKGRRVGTITKDKIEIVGNPPRESSLYFRKPICLPAKPNN